MVIGQKRELVIENIKNAANSDIFDVSTEIGDPKISREESKEIIKKYLDNRNTAKYNTKRFFARRFADIYGIIMGKNLEINGIEKLEGFSGGGIVTSNHFNPDDSTAVRKLAKSLGKNHLNIVVRESNLAMSGPVGFLMNYADTIPINDDFRYLSGEFAKILEKLVDKKELILIYPEQEMWFNYRKPRPLKAGAYHYAAKLNCPVISCFVQLGDTGKSKNKSFNDVKYTLHVLGVIYPEPEKSPRENTRYMMLKDYNLKKNAYEKIYGKKLNYTFEFDDIAGWKLNERE